MVQVTSEDYSAHDLFGMRRALIPRFYYESETIKSHDDRGQEVIELDEATGQAKTRSVECIEISIVGDPTNTPRRRVVKKDREIFAKEYKLWKEGQSYAVEGTPLGELPGISASQVNLYALYNITSIEQMAELDDAKMQSLGLGARALVARAKKWIADRDGAADDIQAASRLANLEAQLAEVMRQREAERAELKAAKMALEVIRGRGDDEEDEDRPAPSARSKRGGRRKSSKEGGTVEAANPNAVAEDDFTPSAVVDDSPNPFADGDGTWDPAAEILKAAG